MTDSTMNDTDMSDAEPQMREGEREREREYMVGRRAVLIAGLVALLAVGVTVWNVNASWDDRTRAVDALHAAQNRVADARSVFDAARNRLRQDHIESRRVRAERDGAQLSVSLRDAQLHATETDRDQSSKVRDAKNAEVAIVRQCLGGAGKALDAAQRFDTGATVAALQSVDAACRAAQAGQSGPAAQYGFDFPDPFVLTVGPSEYAFATNASGGNIQVLALQGDDGWATRGDALGHFPAWAGTGRTWAPAVLARPGGFVMYYGVRDALNGHECVSRAVATAPAGPYVDTSDGPLQCGENDAIDPNPVVGADGVPALLWVRSHPNAIMARALSADGLSFVGPERELLHATAGWEASNVEAPSMMVTAQGTWMFFSANDWNSRHYAIGVVHCASALGPCDRSAAAPVMSSHDPIISPGGGSVFQPTPGDYRLAFHAYHEPNVGYPASRLFYVARIDLSSGRPVLVQ